MKIKVCGMRDKENISELIALKPDYIGFIFYDKSKRFVVDFPKIDIPSSTKKVGVFVNGSIDEIIEKANKHNLDFVQLHGNETPEFCSALSANNIKIIKAFSVDENFDFSAIKLFERHVSLFLFDTKGNNYGGNGIKFNWELLQNYTGKTPFLLSGGISKNDSAEIMKFKHPAFLGIDINSGFELEPGLKNIKEIKEFKSLIV
ncbi:MAG: phosphoribosylanthranilate isomerase [Lutibacter sp.]|nr:phosphoribosylanthranilate isomerase [Lutibacter sp.]MDT8417588.1 phosphoribosylanthranilate isomerase [Lutibacter sp.]